MGAGRAAAGGAVLHDVAVKLVVFNADVDDGGGGGGLTGLRALGYEV